jgi:hypothetical protein
MPTSTNYLPVTCSCKTCKRLFVEWIGDWETVGKTKHWHPKYDCDECFCQRAMPMYREMIRRQMAKRSQQMFEHNKDADLRYLDPVHTAQFKRKISGCKGGILDDTLSSLNKSIRNTADHIPLPDSAKAGQAADLDSENADAY